MLFTLYKYILRQVLAILAVTTLLLTVLLSFGFALGPMSEGILGPVDMARMIFYLMPGMLSFALPFASAFASTSVFYRMATDNEITAIIASGISYRELLTPVLVLGVILTSSLFYLSNWVIPRFWQHVAEIVEQDYGQLLIQQIQRRQVMDKFRPLLIYADSATGNIPIDFSNWPAQTPRPYNRILLTGVAVGKADVDKTTKSMKLKAINTAERAVVDFYRMEESSYVTMKLTNVTVNDPGSGTLVTIASQPVEAMEIPSPILQDPKFLSLRNLDRLEKDPDRSLRIRQQRQKLSELLANHAILDYMALGLKQNADGRGLEMVGPQDQYFRFRGSKIKRDSRQITLEGDAANPVEVQVWSRGVMERRLTAEQAVLQLLADNLSDEPRLTAMLHKVTIHDRNLPQQTSQRQTYPLPMLGLSQLFAQPLRTLSSEKTLAEAKRVDDEEIASTASTLERQIRRLMREITSRRHERAATAVNCMLVLMLGAVIAMRLRQHVVLWIFFCSFVPAILAIIAIVQGQSMMEDLKLDARLGIAMIWSGNLALFVLLSILHLKLRMN